MKLTVQGIIDAMIDAAIRLTAEAVFADLKMSGKLAKTEVSAPDSHEQTPGAPQL